MTPAHVIAVVSLAVKIGEYVAELIRRESEDGDLGRRETFRRRRRCWERRQERALRGVAGTCTRVVRVGAKHYLVDRGSVREVDVVDAEDHGRVLIVTGLPRSGTSLVMQVLQAGGVEVWTDARRAPDAHNPRGYFELSRVAKAPTHGLGFLRRARGRAVKVVSPLLQYLPKDLNYDVLFIVRGAYEVVASQNAMLGRAASDLDEELVTAFSNNFGDTCEVLAGASMCTVSHYNLCMSPRDEIERIRRFLVSPLRSRRDFNVDAAVAVVDPALYRNRLTRGVS